MSLHLVKKIVNEKNPNEVLKLLSVVVKMIQMIHFPLNQELTATGRARTRKKRIRND